MIIYSMVQKTRAKTGAPIISAYKDFGFYFTLKRAGFFLEAGVIAYNALPQLKKEKKTT